MRRREFLPVALAIMSSLPLLLFVYMGQFSRVIGDDYIHLTIGRELGPWGSMIHWRDTFNGSYTYYFLHGLVAPLGTWVPALMPTAIIVLWFLGLFILVRRLLLFLQVERGRSYITFALTSLLLASAINAFYTTQSIQWYSASLRYGLPLALLTIYLAIVLESASRLNHLRSSLAVSIAGAAFCFVNAGLSEMYLVFQLSFMTFLLFFGIVFVGKPVRRNFFILFGRRLGRDDLQSDRPTLSAGRVPACIA